MSMLDSFFSGKGFKAPKCKTLLKLTIPRIKLLRNRREIQIKQMRRDIAKLLETGQEATARIRVEHIIREEKMMAAQEIIELFSELIAVRLPIIEVQRECPIDLKEAISSVCFAAPRCADLPELLQVQMLFAAKFGKEFVAAATELRPECGVNRQLIELLSVRAPAPDVKLKLLKEIAEEHELDWDPAASETELLKPHEDLLNGPTQFVSGSKVPFPEEKPDESLRSTTEQAPNEESDSDADFDVLDFPEVPKALMKPGSGAVPGPEMLPFPASALSGLDYESEAPLAASPHELPLETEKVLQEKSVTKEKPELSKVSVGTAEEKQFLPFISPPSLPSASFSVKQKSQLPSTLSRTKSEVDVDLQDVLAAAQAAAESAERAAAAARSAASLAQVRISELVKKKNEEASEGISENPFAGENNEPDLQNKLDLSRHNSSHKYDDILHSPSQEVSNLPSYDDPRVEFESSPPSTNVFGGDSAHHQPQRLPSLDDEAYDSYPNLFASQGSYDVSRANSFTDTSRTTGRH